ncbi:hypothetical protein KM043_015332 [Ampulex compressa]|nr:hypothetical protein KM043_015332 [Ampulex compressa]
MNLFPIRVADVAKENTCGVRFQEFQDTSVYLSGPNIEISQGGLCVCACVPRGHSPLDCATTGRHGWAILESVESPSVRTVKVASVCPARCPAWTPGVELFTAGSEIRKNSAASIGQDHAIRAAIGQGSTRKVVDRTRVEGRRDDRAGSMIQQHCQQRHLSDPRSKPSRATTKTLPANCPEHRPLPLKLP